MRKIENKCTEFRKHADTLESLSRKLDISQSTHMKAKADQIRVAQFGGKHILAAKEY